MTNQAPQALQAAQAPSALQAAQAPTIGRRVYFWPSGQIRHAFAALDASKPLEAGVVFVHNDGLVNLSVTDHLGQTHAAQNVPFVQNGGLKPPGHYAAWMPYQVAQQQTASQPVQQANLEKQLAAEAKSAHPPKTEANK